MPPSGVIGGHHPVVLADVLLTSTTLVVRLCTAVYSSASTTYY